MLRLAFLGTGRLAQPVFAALCDSPHQMVGLATQPDRTGRGHHQHVNPLKELAISRGIPVHQPEIIRTPESIALLSAWQADLFVVAAYGQILPKSVLEMPRLGCINVHASLLPKYRGATPIHAAILNGDTESGVTIIQLEATLDTGPMRGVVRTPIAPQETTGELEARLAELAVPLTLRVIDELENGTNQAEAQNPALVSHVGKLTKEDGWIPWEKSAREVECHIRGMQPWPGPFTMLCQPDRPSFRLKILEVAIVDEQSLGPPGMVSAVMKETFAVQCGRGTISIQKLQPDGKRPMPTADFLRGRAVEVGDRLASNRENSPEN